MTANRPATIDERDVGDGDGGGATPEAWARRLVELGVAVREALREARDAGAELATAVAEEGGDTIFAIDRHVEPVMERVIDAWPKACRPLTLVAEGLGEDGRKVFTSAPGQRNVSGHRLLIDPIDGTRNIMYDKRSAWFIAAVAEDRGEATTLRDAFAAAIIELPTAKAGFADRFAATCEGGLTAQRECLSSGACVDLPVVPSRAASLHQGFAQVSNFFPGTKLLAAELMELIVAATLGSVAPGSAAVFDDQYITTAGQMVELMVGHDRFCCDLRPLFYDVLAKRSRAAVRGLECHPYDVAGLLVAERAGVIVTDGFGRPLDAPWDVHSGVHWCGYANAALREQIEPVIQQFFKAYGVEAR